MAHYAEINEDNVVINVITGQNEDVATPEGFADWEEYYGNVTGNKIKRCSYNTKFGVHYTENEEEIIKKTLLELGFAKDDLHQIIEEAKTKEKNSNQILEFTREVKSLNEEDKIKIVEALWKIIYSNKNADIYETNLMRRLTGLLYIDSKIMGDIKNRIKKENLK